MFTLLSSEQSIAEAFVAARQAASALMQYPGARPVDLDTAYAIQAHAIATWPDQVAGWKVGKIPPEQVSSLGAVRLAGPIFTRQVVVSQEDESAKMPVFFGGFAAVEAEYVARLGALPTGKTKFTHAEAAALVTHLYYGIEIASSPLASINTDGSAVTVSDFGNNAGLILGPEIQNWQASDYEKTPVSVSLNDQEVGSGTAAAMMDGPIGAVRFLLETAAERDLPLRAGMLVSTGAVTGVHEASVGTKATATFNGTVRLSCNLVAATPTGGNELA
jgi:2-keto-4-pentenoate hydratase